MSQALTPYGSSIVAVYPDHDSAEHAIRLLHKEGFAIEDLSIIGRDIQVSEEPTGFVSTGDYVSAGARSGALFGGLAGVALGAALLVLPGVGPIVVAGPLAAAVLAGIEGALAGVAVGALSGALIGWGVPRDHAIKYESEVTGGKYLVLTRGNAEEVARARALLKTGAPEQIEVYDHATP
jgi:uncharacterized membrane protein